MGLRAIFAQNLRRIRTEKGVSQEELAYRAGIDRTYISSLERQVYGVSIDVLEQIAKGLKVDPAVFLQKPPKAQTLKR